MAVPYRELTRQQVQKWWSSVRSQYRGILRLAKARKEDIMHLRDLQHTLYQLQQAYDIFDGTAYPPEAEDIRRNMLATMINLIACLRHASHDNCHERDVLFEITQVDVHMLDMSLMEQDLPPLS